MCKIYLILIFFHNVHYDTVYIYFILILSHS
jgi:hypothetical protein